MAVARPVVDVRKVGPEIVAAYRRNGLINFAAAIAFLLVLALVPFLLFVLALLGFLGLDTVWQDEVAPEIRDSFSTPAYELLNSSALRVLRDGEAWWLTAGFALAVWEISAATRVTMTALDRIYGLRRRRSFFELFPRSVGLGLVMGFAVVAAAAMVRFVPVLTGGFDGLLAVVSLLGGWVLAAIVLGAAVALVVHHGTATRQTLPWVTVGTGLVMASWIGTSILFGIYVTYVANYESVFGNLATFFVLLLYVYASCISFLAGVQADACLRRNSKS
jgi:membrane protein